MAISRREDILAALLATLSTVSNVAESRSRFEGATRAEGVVAVLTPDSEDIIEAAIGANGIVVRRLVVSVEITARGSIPDQVADPAVAGCHAAIMADRTLGGKCTSIDESGLAWDFESADQDAVRVSRQYAIHYQTRATDDTVAS